MRILGIETSCDETAAAVVEDGWRVRSNVIASQIAVHQKTGGIVPEVAAREHVAQMIPVIQKALRDARCSLGAIDAIAVTRGPGLMGSLIVGINTAMALAAALGKPLIPVNHIAGHIYSNWLDRKEAPQFPLVVLTASGGHNELVFLRGHHNFRVLGRTRDDAAGEAFDKVARMLGLPYPGGPAIARLALQGDPKRFPMPRSFLAPGNFEFSFSGIKTFVLRLLEKHPKRSRQLLADVAASFQEAVVDVLSTKALDAAYHYGAREIHLAGGVSANTRLRASVARSALLVRWPTTLSYCTDNAAMIAAAGYFQWKKQPQQFRIWKPVCAQAMLQL